MIRVLELVELPPRLRARLSHGWITVLNEDTGRRWAVRKGEEPLEEESEVGEHRSNSQRAS